MSMALPIWPLLYLLPIQLIWAGPLSTGSLTPRLAEVIPTCAQTCVESFVAENYQTVCGPPPNFECLCVNTTPSGFTIGEGSLECLVSSCEDYTEEQAVDIYKACFGVPDARPNTHTLLTAVATSVVSQTITTLYPTQTNGNIPSSTSHISSSISSTPVSSAAFGSNAVRTTTTTSSVHSSISSLIPDTTTPTTTPTATSEFSTSSAKATAVPAAAPHILTKPQIAGIAVASIGATALILGLGFIFLFLRRKRLQKRYTTSSFGGGKVMDSSLESTPDLAANSTGDFERQDQPGEGLPPPMPRGPLRLVTPNTSSEDGWNHYQRSMETEDIGLAVGPPVRNSTSGPSPKSPISNRTTDSHLLPDKPTYSLFPSPLKINPRNSIPGQGVRPPRVDTSRSACPPSTGPQQFPNIMDNTRQTNFQQQADSRRSLTQSDPFFKSSSPPDIDPFIQANSSVVHPAFRVPPQLSPTDVARRPVPAHQSPSARGMLTSSNRKVPPNLPQTYPSSGLFEQHSRDPIDNSYKRKHYANKKSESSRPLTQGTFFDSDTTSIEEDSDDEPEHLGIRPRSTLSPVAGSPHLRSPFQPQEHQFEYPPVPASTSASPMRYPTSVEQRSQSQLLSSRRLGEPRAREIAGRLETQAPPAAKRKVSASLEPLGRLPASPSASDAGTRQSRGFPQRR